MTKGFFTSVLSLLAGAGIGVATAQERLPAPTATGVPPLPSVEAYNPAPVPNQGYTPAPIIMDQNPALVGGFGEAPPKGPRFTIGGEYLLWWITGQPIRVPMVTTGNPNSANPGAIGDPTTRVLFGNNTVQYGAHSGGRINLGYWFDCNRTIGVEASGFLLQQRSQTFRFASDAAGNPLLAVPLRNQFGQEGADIITFPNAANPQGPGFVTINSITRLWGADTNGLFNVYRGCQSSVDLLGGFRYFDLTDELNANYAFPGGQINGVDRFRTHNQFYGGQIGARGEYRIGAWTAAARGQVALGMTQSTLNIDGRTVRTDNLPGTFPGFDFSQPSNIGRFSSRTFSVIPQVQFKIGYDVTSHLRATVGYDAMFWNNVIRAGNQLDHNINTSQYNGGALVGPAVPVPQSNRSDLWVHGVSFGLQYSW